MNNVNMAGMNAMGGPVGGAMPMNGAPNARPSMQVNDSQQRSQLNTYIYEYFIRNGMYDCARALLASEQPMKVIKGSPRNDGGNGTDEGGDGDSKDDLDSKRPDDLPAPDVPRECPESCFLYEWWCLFWDMFNAQRGKGDGRNVLQYVTHTTQQSRLRQDAQQNMLRGMRPGDMMPQQYQQLLMRNQAGGPNGVTNELRQQAIKNNGRAAPTPQQLQMMKQQQMQRDPSSGDHQQRTSSPASAENAPSPSKRPRLDGGAPFNPQQMPNGRGQAQGMPQQLKNGLETINLTAQQFQNMPAGANAQQLAGYQANLARQQQAQMPGQMAGKMPNAGPPNQGSPMMNQAQGGDAIQGFYNAGEMQNQGGMRNAQPGGGGGGGQPGGGNHALQDYQMQLMLLEQQNKKRLMMARQEQDSMAGGPMRDGQQGAMGPNGQPFQQGASPQGARSVNSPNPSEQMKRGTPHMNPAGMPSPLPEGQNRASPNGLNFMPGQMDPNMVRPGGFNNMMNGMDPNMVNGMRPPSSHPGGAFPNGMTQQQQMMQQRAAANGNWPNGQNGQMIPGPNQGGPQPIGQGTPQPRAMPPPSTVPAGNTTNGRTPSSPQQGAAPPTPQQGNKAAPKKNKNDAAKDAKTTKRATKKGSNANLNSGATPSAEASQEPATPTPATPITPVHPKSFQNGAVQPVTNGQTAAPAANANAAPQPDPLGGGFGMNDTNFDYPGLSFADPNSNMDVLQDFDFDSFLHNDGDANDNFNFDPFGGLDGGEIGAE